MFAWLHRLLNPHCEECRHELVCLTCEALKTALEQANYEKRELLATIVKLAIPEKPEVVIDNTIKEEIKPKFVPWHVKRQMLEAEDKAKAKIIAQHEASRPQKKEIEELEKEVIGEEKENAS